MRFVVRLYDHEAFSPGIANEPWLMFTGDHGTPALTFTGAATNITSGDNLNTVIGAGISIITIDTGDRTFTLRLAGVTPRFYDIAIEANHTLINVKDDVAVHIGPTSFIDMGEVLEGNAINDASELASIINALDASLLAAAINNQVFDARVDFNRDGLVDPKQGNQPDLALLIANYLRFSPIIVP